MTTELVTAHAGKNHIGSEDVGALYAGALGSGRFAFDVGEGLAVTMTDANTVRIGTGVFLMDGRQVRVKEAESVKVANGSQGAFRRDLVTYTYKRDPSNGNVEEGAWSVLQGTAAASEAEAKAPDYVAGNILDGDLTATVAVAEVSLSGLTPTARLLLPSVASLRALGDSVSPVKRQVFNDLIVDGFKRGGCVTVHISGSNSLTRSKNPVKVAELADGCAPRVRVMTLFGVNDSAWGMVRVDTDGRVYLTHMYGHDEIVWNKVDVSVTFAA